MSGPVDPGEGCLHLAFTLLVIAIVWALIALGGRDMAAPLDAEERSRWQAPAQ